MRIYLDFWSDRNQVHGSRRVCTDAEGYPDQCDTPHLIDPSLPAGEFSLHQGFVRMYRPGQRSAPIVDWDFSDRKILVETVDPPLVIDMPGARVNLADEPAPTILASAACDQQRPTPPASPGILSLGSAMILSWTASYDENGVTGYRVTRHDDEPPPAVVGQPTESPFIDLTGLEPDTDYYYKIQAEDPAGNLSYGAQIEATTPPEFNGPTAIELSGEPDGSSIRLYWPEHAVDDSESSINAYVNYRDDVFRAFSSPENLEWVDSNVAPGVTYRYWVRSWDHYGNASPASDEVTVTAN